MWAAVSLTLMKALVSFEYRFVITNIYCLLKVVLRSGPKTSMNID